MLKNLIDRILIPNAASWAMRFTSLTMRVTRVNFSPYRALAKEGTPVIFTFWHGRMFLMATEYRGAGLTVLASRHRDGELVARTIKKFGIDSVRGSTSKGWLGGVRGLLNAVKDGRDIGIIPDGPRGPERVAQPGALLLSKHTGLPVIPVSFSASKKKLCRPGIHL